MAGSIVTCGTITRRSPFSRSVMPSPVRPMLNPSSMSRVTQAAAVMVEVVTGRGLARRVPPRLTNLCLLHGLPGDSPFGMPTASQRSRHSAPPPVDLGSARRARSAAVLTVGLLDALDDVLHGDLDDDALLASTARVVSRELECLCMIERLVDGGARVVGLAHPDPALTSRLRAAYRPETIVSAARATSMLARRAALSKVHAGEREAERCGLAELVASLGVNACSFVAVPLTLRGHALGIMWVVATRRGRVLRAPETESLARAGSVIALAVGAASAATATRVTTSTRRTIIAER